MATTKKAAPKKKAVAKRALPKKPSAKKAAPKTSGAKNVAKKTAKRASNANATILLETYIDASPADVFDALVDPELHAAFTGSAATGKAKTGAEFTAWEGYIRGKHLALERPKRIVQEWSTTEWPKGAKPSRLELTFIKERTGTMLVLVHTDVPASQADGYRAGWDDYYFEPMKSYFAKRPT